MKSITSRTFKPFIALSVLSLSWCGSDTAPKKTSLLKQDTAKPNLVSEEVSEEKSNWDGNLLVQSSQMDTNGKRSVFLYSKTLLAKAYVQLKSGGWVRAVPTTQISEGYKIWKVQYSIDVSDTLTVLATDGISGFSYEFSVENTDEKLKFSKSKQEPSHSVLLTSKQDTQRPTPSENTVAESETSHAANHPPFANKFNYPRQIDPQLQERAQREANILSQYGFEENQRRWSSSNGALGHPVGVPAGYVGGTGCSWPKATGAWQNVGTNSISTCEPGGPRHILVAEAVAYNARDGVWYASRIWKPY